MANIPLSFDWMSMARGAGKGIITASIRAAAGDPACQDRVGKEMYEREHVGKSWSTLSPEEKALWRSRGASALLGLNAFIKVE